MDERDVVYPHYFQKLKDIILIEDWYSSKLSRNACSLLIEDKSYEHWFAHCNWFYPVQDKIRHRFGKPLEIWNRSLLEQLGPSSFIVVFRILLKFVDVPYQFRSKDLMVVVPRTKNSLLWNQKHYELHTMTKILRDL